MFSVILHIWKLKFVQEIRIPLCYPFYFSLSCFTSSLYPLYLSMLICRKEATTSIKNIFVKYIMHFLKPVQPQTKIVFFAISSCKYIDYNYMDVRNISWQIILYQFQQRKKKTKSDTLWNKCGFYLIFFCLFELNISLHCDISRTGKNYPKLGEMFK